MQLIANRWYAVLSSRELAKARPLAARRFGLDLVFWRDAQGRVVAAHDSCPHRRAKLSPGRVVDGCVECPFHGFRFDGDGACTAIPAHPERPIPKAMHLTTLPVREAHDLIFAWVGPDPAPPETEPIPFFDFGGYSFAGSEFHEHVATHYSRAIENQLDFAHLPFVHRTSIGRLVDEVFEISTEVSGDHIIASSAGDGRVELLGPNLWRNETGPVWQFLAFVPIDEERMLYIVRTYQPFVTRRPALAWLLGRAQRGLGRWILRQDTPPVESQPAIETGVRDMDEVLVPSDGPIIAYRRWRDAHRIWLGGSPAMVAASDLLRPRLEGRGGQAPKRLSA